MAGVGTINVTATAKLRKQFRSLIDWIDDNVEFNNGRASIDDTEGLEDQLKQADEILEKFERGE